jgi:hypothetical protein
MYQNLNIVKDINKKRIIWEGHNGRKEGLLLRTMIERKKTTGTPKIKMGRQSKRRRKSSQERIERNYR